MIGDRSVPTRRGDDLDHRTERVAEPIGEGPEDLAIPKAEQLGRLCVVDLEPLERRVEHRVVQHLDALGDEHAVLVALTFVSEVQHADHSVVAQRTADGPGPVQRVRPHHAVPGDHSAVGGAQAAQVTGVEDALAGQPGAQLSGRHSSGE